MLRVELKVVGGKNQGQVIVLAEPKFLVGREQDCHLRPNSELVSRHHCIFTIDEFGLHLRDLGSTNGTRVNNERIHGQIGLNAGDQVTIGTLTFEVVIKQPALVGGTAADQSPAASVGTDNPALPTLEQPDSRPTSEETTAISGGETQIGIPVYDPNAAPAGTGDTGRVDTAPTVIEQPNPYPMPQMPYPQPPGGMFPGQQMPQYPMPGYAPPSMPYPMQYPPGYGPPPGYGQPMYGQPGMGYPGMPQDVPAETDDDDDVERRPDVNLPPPEETGAKESGETKGSDGGKPATGGVNPGGAAEDIIKQYRQRRPGTGSK